VNKMGKKKEKIEYELQPIVKKVLEEPFWPMTLETREVYSRLHDDHDGTFLGELNVTIGPDGDAWVYITGERPLTTLRFRSFSGGGQSLRVRNALLILAEAIRMDNEDKPIQKDRRNKNEEKNNECT